MGGCDDDGGNNYDILPNTSGKIVVGDIGFRVSVRAALAQIRFGFAGQAQAGKERRRNIRANQIVHDQHN